MPSNRREFVRRTALVAAALGTRAIPAGAQPAGAMPTPRAAAFMKMFG